MDEFLMTSGSMQGRHRVDIGMTYSRERIIERLNVQEKGTSSQYACFKPLDKVCLSTQGRRRVDAGTTQGRRRDDAGST